MTDYQKFPIDLTPEHVRSGITSLTVVGDVQESKGDYGGVYTLTVADKDKKRFRLTLFERDFQPFAEFMRSQPGLTEENGIRVTVKVIKYSKRDKTPAEKVGLEKVEGPAQASL
ncbi:MAG: hypothetical protein WC766_06195 [Patescibacteria group bacterium]|jgi:hypothetical protein